jgi:cytochrome c-type biogenesis protein CcmE
VEGVISNITNSKPGTVVYLLFTAGSDKDAARVAINVTPEQLEATKQMFEPFSGKKVRVAGTVKHVTVKGLSRPDVVITDFSAVSNSP